MAKRKKPVSVWGIEFDALIDDERTMTSTIPEYPVEKGFPVSDTIINDPITISMNLYITDTPVTWLYRHGTSQDRVKKICKQIENAWAEKKLTKIVTSDKIYRSMGITSIAIKKSADIGYAREVAITAKKVRVTKKKTVTVPTYVLKSGETEANAGNAATSTSSAKSTATSSSSSSSSSSASDNTSSSSSSGSSSSSSSSSSSTSSSGSSSNSSSKKNASILYGVAKGIKLI